MTMPIPGAIPSYMWLGGDEDSGVTLICDHVSHRDDDYGIAYHGGHGESGAHGLPYFSSRDLGKFLAFIRDHARSHLERAS